MSNTRSDNFEELSPESSQEDFIDLGETSPLKKQIAELESKNATLLKYIQELEKTKQAIEVETKELPFTMAKLQKEKDRLKPFEEKVKALDIAIKNQMRDQYQTVLARLWYQKKLKKLLPATAKDYLESIKSPLLQMRNEFHKKRVSTKTNLQQLTANLNKKDAMGVQETKLTELQLLLQSALSEEKQQLEKLKPINEKFQNWKNQSLVPLQKYAVLWHRTEKAIKKNATDLTNSIMERNKNAAAIEMKAMDLNFPFQTCTDDSIINAFIKAIDKSNLQQAEKLFNPNIDINKINITWNIEGKEQNVSLLWMSLLKGNESAAIWLLKHGANPDQRNPITSTFYLKNGQKACLGLTPLIFLVSNKIDLAQNRLAVELLAQKANVNLEDSQSPANTALYLATYNNSISNVRFLCEHGADANLINKNGETPLQLAQRCSSWQIQPEIKDLLTHQSKISLVINSSPKLSR